MLAFLKKIEIVLFNFYFMLIIFSSFSFWFFNPRDILKTPFRISAEILSLSMFSSRKYDFLNEYFPNDEPSFFSVSAEMVMSSLFIEILTSSFSNPGSPISIMVSFILFKIFVSGRLKSSKSSPLQSVKKPPNGVFIISSISSKIFGNNALLCLIRFFIFVLLFVGVGEFPAVFRI